MADVYCLRARRWLTPLEVAARPTFAEHVRTALAAELTERRLKVVPADAVHICIACARTFRSDAGYRNHTCKGSEARHG